MQIGIGRATPMRTVAVLGRDRLRQRVGEGTAGPIHRGNPDVSRTPGSTTGA